MSRLFKAVIMISLSIFCLGAYSADNIIEAKVDKTDIKTGEVFSYKLKIEGYFSEPKLNLPQFKDFRIVSQSQTKNFSFSEGKQKITINIVYFLFAPSAGSFVIEEVTLQDGSNQYKTKPITIKVEGRPLKEKRKILPYLEEGIDL